MRCCLFQVDEFELEAVSLGELSRCEALPVSGRRV